MRHALRAIAPMIGLVGWGVFGAGTSAARAQVYYTYRPAQPAYVVSRPYAAPVRYYAPAAAAPRAGYYYAALRGYVTYAPRPAVLAYRHAVPTTWRAYRPATPAYYNQPYAPAATTYGPHWSDDTNTLIQDSL